MTNREFGSDPEAQERSEAEAAFLEIKRSKEQRDEYNTNVGNIISRLKYDYYDLTDEERTDYYNQLQRNQHLFRTAINQRFPELGALMDIERLAEVRDYDEESDNMESGQNKFMRLAFDTIIDLRPDIREAMKQGRLEPWYGLRVFDKLIMTGTKRDQVIGISALADNIDLIEQGINHPQAQDGFISLAREIVERGDHTQTQLAAQALERAIEKADNKKLPILISTLFIRSKEALDFPELIYSGWKAVRSTLEKLGLPYDEFVQAWMKSTKSEKIGSAVYDNLKVITELEEAKKGTTLFLYREFGILDFGRYPSALLLKQVEEVEDTSKPWGVIMYPRNDWNGAFYADKDAFEELLTSVKGEFSLRVVECEGKRDVARNLIKLDRKYNPSDGSGHKVSLAIIGGHGTENTIRFGGDDDRHVLRTEDLLGKGTAKASQFFEVNPTIILVSCSTGAEKGIGQELSEKFGAKVIAPKIPTNISGLHASRNRGQSKFRFNATFRDKEAKNMHVAGQETKKNRQ
jgi:hypothetical protein